MWGDLRGPSGPVQVTCALAAAVLAASLSISPAYAQHNPGTSIPEKHDRGAVEQRVGVNTVTIASGNPDTGNLACA
jgi:hypothetical protein